MTQIELIPGTTRYHALSQFFTPPKLARRLVEWALGTEICVQPTRVLEPSAGNGAIVRELVKAGAEVYAVEVDGRYRAELFEALGEGDTAQCPTDFLRLTCHDFDLVCGNFPFHEDLTGEFTLHALKFAPRLCAIYPANVFYSEQREEFWKQVRPTRIAHIAKRPWPGATDYVALELVKRDSFRYVGQGEDKPVRMENIDHVTVEWWFESWH